MYRHVADHQREHRGCDLRDHPCVHFDSDYGCKEFSNTDDGGYALVRTVLGKLAMRMLLDHKTEIGHRSLGPPSEVWIVSLTSCTDSLS